MKENERKPNVMEDKGKLIPSLGYIRVKFIERGYTLLAKEYVNRVTPLRYHCPKHGTQEIAWQYFIRGYGCPQCNAAKHSIEYIRIEFEKRGYELISTEYANETDLLKYRCPKHGEKEVIWRSFRRRKNGCPDCRKEKGNQRKPRTLSEKDKAIIGKTFHWLTVMDVHEIAKGKHTLFTCQCKCGTKTHATRYQMEYKLKKSCGCLRKERHVKYLKMNGEKKSYQVWASELGISVETLTERVKEKIPYKVMMEIKRKKNTGRKSEFISEGRLVQEKLKHLTSDLKKETFARHDYEVNGKKVLVLYSHGNQEGKGSFCFSYSSKQPREATKLERKLPNGKFKTSFKAICDYVLFVVSNETNCYMWVMPSDELDNEQQGLALLPNGNSKYNRFLNAWELLSK